MDSPDRWITESLGRELGSHRTDLNEPVFKSSGARRKVEQYAMTYACATCAKASCFKGELDRMPKTCPTQTHPSTAKDIEPYLEDELASLMRAADRTPIADDGSKRNRVQELIHFAQTRGIRRVGIAFCVTLTKEAQELSRQLRGAGLETELVCCRVGAIDYGQVGLPKAHPERFAAICNPVAQGRLLNEAKVELVAQIGLCIGHDLILQEQCDAPVTTLVVKDRVLDHHPIAALRTTEVAHENSRTEGSR